MRPHEAILLFAVSFAVMAPTAFAQSTGTPTFNFSGSATGVINASTGGYVDAVGVPVLVHIPAGTYALVNGQQLSTYSFRIENFWLSSVPNPSGTGQNASYGTAFEINNNLTGRFVSSSGSPVALQVSVRYPSTEGIWLWTGGTVDNNGHTYFDGTPEQQYIGGSYSGQLNWASYNQTTGNTTTLSLSAPALWVFTTGATPPKFSTTTTIGGGPASSTSPTISIQNTQPTIPTQPPSGGSNTALYGGIAAVAIIVIAVLVWVRMRKPKTPMPAM